MQFRQVLSAAGKAGAVAGGLLLTHTLTHSLDRGVSGAVAQCAGPGASRVDRLEQIEKSLARVEQRLSERVALRPSRGTPIDVVLGAQW
jgi:hypothetical protein